MHGTYDTAADAAYIYLVNEIEPGGSKRQAVAEVDGFAAMVVFDLDDQNRVLGIEIVGARGSLQTETLAGFTQL
jgi:uncharacterized protein YuzE